jgi:excisionase family DNA binding protein
MERRRGGTWVATGEQLRRRRKIRMLRRRPPPSRKPTQLSLVPDSPPKGGEESHGSGTSLPQLLTVEELAALLRVSKPAVYALVERGRIPKPCIVRLGRSLRFRVQEVTMWLQGSRGTQESP